MHHLPVPSQNEITRLIEAALRVRQNAHAPYSGFHVGAAILGENGSIHTGCNVEISSYGLTCCAERTALFSAVSAGVTSFIAIAIVAGHNGSPPCGACRQALADFSPSMHIIIAHQDGTYRLTTLADLYPEPFLPSGLK